MRIGILAAEPGGPQALGELADQVRRAADDGLASVWMSNIFGLDALTALAVAGSQVPGIELGTAVVPTYPRHPAVLAQQALTAALAAGPGRLTLGIGLSHKIVIEDMYGYTFDRPARHMREYLSVLLPLLDGTAVSVDGSTLSAHIGLSVPVCVTSDPAAARAGAGKAFAIYGQLPSYRAMLDREGAADPGDVAIVGDEDAVAARIADLADAGVTDFTAAEFARGPDRERTRTLLKTLAAAS